ncbi:MAG: hypothetical protein JXR31_07000 [Prolixibacteraceae bacterium]|nr:hypothetical protein [Prolixibacteraceae bacterium]
MSYREKENIVNIFSSLLITSVYALIIYQKQKAGLIDLTDDFQKWGIVFLIFAGVSIVARITIYIVFSIVNAIATKEEKIPKEDERDKLIKLKATRNSHYTSSVGFFIAIILLAVGMPSYWLFIVFVISGVISELIDNGSQMYYYRKGV